MESSMQQSAQAQLDTLSAPERQQLDAWLAADTPLDQLFEELGRRQGGLRSMGEDPVERGKVIVENLSPTIKGRICGSEMLRAYADGGNSDTGDLLNATGALAALLAPAVGAGVTSFLLAVIVLRIGVRSFCASQWTP